LVNVSTKPASTVNSALVGLLVCLLVTIDAAVSWAIYELVRKRQPIEFVFDSLDKGQVGGGAPSSSVDPYSVKAVSEEDNVSVCPMREIVLVENYVIAGHADRIKFANVVSACSKAGVGSMRVLAMDEKESSACRPWIRVSRAIGVGKDS
jgi:hypothetical protein